MATTKPRHGTMPHSLFSPLHPPQFNLNTPAVAPTLHSASAMLHTIHNANYFHVINIQRTIAKGFAPKTLQNYSPAIHTFLYWCKSNHIHEDIRFPASEYVLCAYTASLAGSRSKSSINGILAGLKAWHNASGHTWNNSPRLSMKSFTTDMLAVLLHSLNCLDPFDAAVAAAALFAFWGQCHLGELLGTAKLKHDPTKHPSRSSLGPAISIDGSRKLHLPSTKTSRTTGESVTLTAQRDSICPVSAINHLFNLTPNLPLSAHLFAHPAHNHPNITHSLSKAAFLNRANDIWRSAGHTTVSVHAFRIGSTTCLLRAGIAPEIVRSMGRWSSDAHFRYWRDTASLAIDHAENISTTRNIHHCGK